MLSSQLDQIWTNKQMAHMYQIDKDVTLYLLGNVRIWISYPCLYISDHAFYFLCGPTQINTKSKPSNRLVLVQLAKEIGFCGENGGC